MLTPGMRWMATLVVGAALTACGGGEEAGSEPMDRVEISPEGSPTPNIDMPDGVDTVVAPVFDVEPATDTTR